MKNILNFFKDELNNCNENKVRIESDIHRANIDIEFLSKARNNIVSELDNTHDIFSANGSDTTFNSREIILLGQKETNLIEFISMKSLELNQIQDRIVCLNKMIDECYIVGIEENLSVSGVEILEIQEDERKRIARDIHDSVVQKMTVLIHKSEFAMRIIDSDILRAKLELEVINKVVRECIDELRGVIYNLRPMSLDDLGLEITLKRNIAKLNNSTDMNITLNYNSIDINKMNSIISVTVLRILEELCSNAIKYSEGSMVNIELYEKNEILHIMLEDDGIGINENQKDILNNKNSGFGIPFLKERVKLLKGTIETCNYIENRGTRYIIEIPFHNEEKNNGN